MCTSPNYVAYRLHPDKKGRFIQFLGKRPYKDMRDSTLQWIQVPCGQCLECRIQQARTWADRVVLEAKQYKHNYFVTLTYDDLHLPSNFSLVPDDLSKFVRSVRDKFKDVKIKFFGCGEYGDISRRPHYHVILFNCPLDDLSYEFKQADWQYVSGYDANGEFKTKLVMKRLVNHLRPSNNGDLKYSELIHKSWNYKGQISVGDVNYDTAAYVSQYVTKKHKPGMKEFYDKLGIEPEFVRMSTHPGIAANYYHQANKFKLYRSDLIVPSKNGAHCSVVPRYFDKLYVKEFGESEFDKIAIPRSYARIRKLNEHCFVGIDSDINNYFDDYRVKKRQRLRDKI